MERIQQSPLAKGQPCCVLLADDGRAASLELHLGSDVQTPEAAMPDDMVVGDRGTTRKPIPPGKLVYFSPIPCLDVSPPSNIKFSGCLYQSREGKMKLLV